MKVKLFVLLGVLLLVGTFTLFGTVSPASAQGPTPNPNPAPYGQWGGWGMTLAPHASAGVGGWFNQSSSKMTVTMEQARTSAAQYLKTYLPNATVEEKGDTFYGYYHFGLQNSKTFGMLSVNGYTGAVWYHTWHGDFVASKELD